MSSFFFKRQMLILLFVRIMGVEIEPSSLNLLIMPIPKLYEIRQLVIVGHILTRISWALGRQISYDLVILKNKNSFEFGLRP